MAGPITPDEVVDLKRRSAIPGMVFDAFNELIAKHWNGHAATVKQDEIVELILKKYSHSTSVTRRSVFADHWLDIETVYEAAGWKVVYDKPGYNESGASFFEFTKA
jgi:hypothetical protein